MRVLVAILFLLPAAGCVLTLSEPQTGCACPAGQACVDDQCVPTADAGAPPDAAPPREDAATPDASAPVELQSCEAQFGAATGYVLCAEDEASCAFFAQTAGGTCADQCALFASECVGGYDSNVEAPCTVVAEDGCLATHSTQTCICARASAAVSGQ